MALEHNSVYLDVQALHEHASSMHLPDAIAETRRLAEVILSDRSVRDRDVFMEYIVRVWGHSSLESVEAIRCVLDILEWGQDEVRRFLEYILTKKGDQTVEALVASERIAPLHNANPWVPKPDNGAWQASLDPTWRGIA